MYYIYPPVRQIGLAVASSALVALRVVDCVEVRTTLYSTFSSLSKSAINQGRRKKTSHWQCYIGLAGTHALECQLGTPVPADTRVRARWSSIRQCLIKIDASCFLIDKYEGEPPFRGNFAYHLVFVAFKKFPHDSSIVISPPDSNHINLYTSYLIIFFNMKFIGFTSAAVLCLSTLSIASPIASPESSDISSASRDSNRCREPIVRKEWYVSHLIIIIHAQLDQSSFQYN